MVEKQKGMQDPGATPAEPKKEEKKEELTLDGLSKQNREMNEKLEKILKQNADKDSFISKLEGENKELRGNLEKVSQSLTGKTEKQKDAIFEKQKQALIEKGFAEADVDAILSAMDALADARAEKKTSEKIVPIVIDTVEELIDSDSEIDKEFVKANNKEIWIEYDSFKVEITPRKIKSNFKKAYGIVKDRLAKKATMKGKTKEEIEREKMLKGGVPPPSGGKGKILDEEQKFIDSIEKAGPSGGRFI